MFDTEFENIAVDNPCLNTDSYKLSHFMQLPDDQTATFSYISSRGGKHGYSIMAGLQPFLIDLVNTPITEAHVTEAKKIATLHGLPFNYDGFMYVVNKYGGHAPVTIQAIPEGTPVPSHNVLVTVETDDPKCAWYAGFLETAMLRAVWYMSNVATRSFSIKQKILQALIATGDPISIAYMLHDFGARGVSSKESAGLGGCGHLMSFSGTDNITSLLYAMKYYGAGMAGFSIPAAEHSTITVYGRDGEAQAYRRLLQQFARPGSIVAIVSDSYDIENAVVNIWGNELRQEVIDSGATVVIRPDSGDPVDVVMMCLRKLDDAYGHTINDKGYKVLNYVRVIQGDGIDEYAIDSIMAAVIAEQYSINNIAFGMGGALLQAAMRDDHKVAMKCSAAYRTSTGWVDVYKDPVTDPGKRSLKGRVTTMRRPSRSGGSFDYITVRVEEQPQLEAEGWTCALELKYRNGQLYNLITLDAARANSQG